MCVCFLFLRLLLDDGAHEDGDDYDDYTGPTLVTAASMRAFVSNHFLIFWISDLVDNRTQDSGPVTNYYMIRHADGGGSEKVAVEAEEGASVAGRWVVPWRGLAAGPAALAVCLGAGLLVALASKRCK